MKKYLFLPVILFLSLFLSAQVYLPFKQIQNYTRNQKPNHYDSSLTYLTNRLGIEIHYLYPLYQAIGWEEKFKKKLGDKTFYDDFSQFLSFAGDYGMASEYVSKSFDALPDSIAKNLADAVGQLKDIQYAPAKTSILDNAEQYRVVMINEDRAKPVHRAFTYSLLEDLYKEGYHYLAMEMLNNLANHCLDSLNVFTGFYTNEPIAGELIRKALQTGYTLVSYEDTLAYRHTNTQRDSIQAANIYSVIKKDPSAKILVHAGSAHIGEEKTTGYIPMGYWFKKISGIDPFTVEQTSLTEGSNFEYGKLFYEYFTSKFSITEPSVIFQNKRSLNPFGAKGYDIIVVHPPTLYKNNRPSWLSLGGDRQPVLIQPTERSLFFVQAYYENEYQADKLKFLVPADQTYIANSDGYYCLYLRKGRYKIVLRDIGYKILSTKDMEVK
ncbi:MAG: hypothetical protein Q8941_17630 [Bacteroidota bacterium]|nr:hypothetical protein [Bacteroidota bacterium]